MTDVVLASTSRTRKALLQAAGVAIIAEAPQVDEAAVKQALKAEGASAADAAEALAELKALAVSRQHPEALVIGADQMLDCGGAWFDKPTDMAAARQQLLALRGKTHHLLTAAVVAFGGQPIWRHVENAAMTMRPFSESFLDHYLVRVGSAVLASVGAYQLEGPGAQLFSRIDGEHFAILGLPLLPLLDLLRTHGALEA